MSDITECGWRNVCPLNSLTDGGASLVDGGPEPLAAVRVDGEVFMVSDLCTHAEASLAEGEVDTDDFTVECPRHGALFDLRSGEALTLPATRPVRTYAVEIRDGDVWVKDVARKGEVSDGR